MGKRAKMCKALIAGLLAVTMAFTAQTGSTWKAEAAQFKGESFGVGFAGEEYATMHKADGWSNGDMFNCTWRADNVWFDGYLNLKIDRDYATGGYSGGEYRTNDTFGYGMYDVSMKAIKNDGVVTSFFTYTGPSDGTVWDEIDIEILGKDTTKVQFNYYTNGVGNHEYVYDLGFDASQGFHQYGFLWLPGRITWYVDGKEVYTATNNIPTTPGKIMMNVWPGIGVDEWLKPYNGRTPLVAQYDWINWKQVEGGSSNSGSTGNNTNNNTNNNTGTSGGNALGSSFTIEAENYTYMSGVEKAGNCVGYIDPGDWMSYEINVANAGTYSVEFRLASALGSSFRLEKDSGTEVLADVTVPNTGDWGAYKSVYADVYLTAGKNNIAIATDRGAFNIDKMVFTAKGGNTDNNTGNNTNNNNTNNNNWNNNTNNNNTNNNQNNNTNTGTTVGSSFTIEAENYSNMSGVEKAGNCVAYIDPGDWMSYDINVASAGTYSVEICVASAMGSSFRLEKNSGKEVLANVDVPNTGDWGAYKSVYVDVALTAGKNTIGVATDRGGFNLDKMVFTAKSGSNTNTGNNTNNNSSNNNNTNNNTTNNQNNSANSGSTGTTSATFTVEAENYNYMSGVEKAGNCVAYIDPGDWMSYEVNVPSAGTYSVEIRVASALGSSFRLEKDSGTEVLANVNVPNTGDWNAYKSVYAEVYLTAGKNTIGIATDRGGFNIDKMVFTK
ncbi:MAG: carbohydrate-binding protein [Lachnospiraceae bacterium]|nr:carbohydrate-binding protein [Lachnospiraceae bacterium]